MVTNMVALTSAEMPRSGSTGTRISTSCTTWSAAATPRRAAWTTVLGQKKMRLFDSRKHLVRHFGNVADKPGEITAIGEHRLRSIRCSAKHVSRSMKEHEHGS